jgi:glycosyltransferase involved in cell wall biosynthesis
VIEKAFRFYPGFAEPEPFHPDIPVHYTSSLPIPRVNGLWASVRMVTLLQRRHKVAPFDIVIVLNFKRPQVACARYARRHRLPLVLEYEDDAFHDVTGEPTTKWVTLYHHRTYRKVLRTVSGCMAASPHLLAQVPTNVPKLLLRGVIGDDILRETECRVAGKRNVVLFAGTHNKWNGVEELITAWRILARPDWELHITGYGDMTEYLHRLADDTAGVVFHGLLRREELVSLMCSARVCVSPQLVSEVPGSVFPFKVIEYLAAGAHVVMTPMGLVETEVERGITYLSDNTPRVIASTLQRVIETRRYEATAQSSAQLAYGSAAVAKTLDALLRESLAFHTGRGKRWTSGASLSDCSS